MRRWRWILVPAALSILAGCAAKTNDIRIGMTREEVVAVMGTPASTSEMGREAYLKYRLYADWIFPERYYVRLTDGKVDAYGRVGDFNLGY